MLHTIANTHSVKFITIFIIFLHKRLDDRHPLLQINCSTCKNGIPKIHGKIYVDCFSPRKIQTARIFSSGRGVGVEHVIETNTTVKMQLVIAITAVEVKKFLILSISNTITNMKGSGINTHKPILFKP